MSYQDTNRQPPKASKGLTARNLDTAEQVATFFVARDETFAFTFRKQDVLPLTDEQVMTLKAFESHPAIVRMSIGNQGRLRRLVERQHEYLWGGGRAKKYGALCSDARWAYEALLPTEGNVRRVLVVLQRHLLTFGPHVAMSHNAGVFLVKQHFGVTLDPKTVGSALKRIVELGIFDRLSAGRSWKDPSGPAASAVFAFVLPAQAPSDTPLGSLLLNSHSPYSGGVGGRGYQQDQEGKKKRRTAWIELPETIEPMTKAEIREFEAWRTWTNGERRHGLDEWKAAGPAEACMGIKHLDSEQWVEVPSSDSEGSYLPSQASRLREAERPAETRMGIKPSAFVNVSTFGSPDIRVVAPERKFVHPVYGEMSEAEYELVTGAERIKASGFGKGRATRFGPAQATWFDSTDSAADSVDNERNLANTG